MKRFSITFTLASFLLVAIQVACNSSFTVSGTPTPTVSIIGILRPWTAETPIAGRHLALCRSQGDPRNGLCDLMPDTVISDRQGRFQFYDVPEGTYFLMYDSGLSDFDAAVVEWAGKTLRFGDQQWLSDFLGVDISEDVFEYRLPERISISPSMDWLSSYCLLTLLVGESPLIIAHDLDSASHDHELHCALVNILPGQTSKVEVQVLYFGE